MGAHRTVLDGLSLDGALSVLWRAAWSLFDLVKNVHDVIEIAVLLHFVVRPLQLKLHNFLHQPCRHTDRTHKGERVRGMGGAV